MLRTAKEIAYVGVMTALLIGGQLALAGIGGVEIVTVLFLSFCVTFGAVRGMATATAFSLLRCFIWGFFPTVIILYLIYYNLFAVVFGFLGAKTKKLGYVPKIVILTVAACIMTVIFTMIDNVVTPLFYGYSPQSAYGYFLASLPFMTRQTICAAVTVAVLFYPLNRAFTAIKKV